MHSAVKDIWVAFNEPLEGLVTSLYADVKGLVTTGMGNLVDPMPLALVLPWELPGGIAASKDSVALAWQAVKGDPQCASRGWKYAAQLPLNNVRLTRDSVSALIVSKLAENDLRMRVRFGDWESRPADAQLAVHSMSWAMGPMFFKRFPKFTAMFTRGDYAAASNECAISPPHGTIVERNARNRQLLLNAATSADPAVLQWQLPST
jgi:GH24 family phage-related lysozyme (muramidase)